MTCFLSLQYIIVKLYNIFWAFSLHGVTLDLLPLVIVSLVIGYMDKSNQFVSSEVKFATAVSSIIPLSYYIGMGIARWAVTPEQHQNLTNTFDRSTVVISILSISAQSNFAVGAVVNATFGSITELTFYITALLRGHHQGNKCLQEIVKAALTGTLLGCILFIPVWDLLHHRGSEICQVCNAWPLYLSLRGSVW